MGISHELDYSGTATDLLVSFVGWICGGKHADLRDLGLHQYLA